tara:strand:- start:112 stop:1032 length:921 start_codon:yes stop_codon:yes gene_type:complete
LFKKTSLEPGVGGEIARINADIILQSFDKIGCHAFSPGEKDFAAGKDFIVESSKNVNFPFISANIYDLDQGLLFNPYIIYELKGINVAFIGLTSNFISEEIIVKDPIESLKPILTELESKADIKILLFSSSNDDMRRLQAESLNLSMIIRSKNKKKSADGGKGIPTYSLGDRGRTLYAFDLEINDSSVELTDLASFEKVIKQSNINLNKMKKGDSTVDLKTLFRDDPIVLEKIFKYESNIEEANQKIENAINKITINKVDLGKKIDSQIDILKIIDDGKVKIKELTNLNPNYRVPHDHDGDGIPDH